MKNILVTKFGGGMGLIDPRAFDVKDIEGAARYIADHALTNRSIAEDNKNLPPTSWKMGQLGIEVFATSAAAGAYNNSLVLNGDISRIDESVKACLAARVRELTAV